jgi:hypothetical protein
MIHMTRTFCFTRTELQLSTTMQDDLIPFVAASPAMTIHGARLGQHRTLGHPLHS